MKFNTDLLKFPIKETLIDEIVSKIVTENNLDDKETKLIKLSIKATLEILQSTNLIKISE